MDSKTEIPTTTIHGVFMDVYGLGVFLTGASGIGKSETALGLISRGHRLIADDATTFQHAEHSAVLIGNCPPLLKNFLEVRGLGVINIHAMFGENAINDHMPLQLIIHFMDIASETIRKSNRLEGVHSTETVLGVKIPKVTIPVGPGRSLTVLVETAVRNHRLKLSGYDAHADFTQRQRQFMQSH